MPRKGFIAKRDVLPDPIYNSKVVTKLINNVMLDGKKTVAQEIVYDAFDIIKEKTGREPLEVFQEALNNVMPVLEVKARRVGGATYQVPLEIRPERRQTLGLRWLVKYARTRNEKTMAEKLANEIMDAVAGNGGAFKKKEDIGLDTTPPDVGHYTQFQRIRPITKDIKGNINGREVSITNGDEAVAFELREKDANGKLLYFSTFIKFEVPLTVSLTYAKLYAVQADGKRILLEE